MASDKKSALHTFLFVFLLTLLFLFLDKLGQINWLKGVFADFLNPVRSAIYSVYQRTMSADKKQDKHGVDRRILEEKLGQLEIENQVFKVKVAELERENQSMRRLLQAPLPASWQFLPAKVVGFAEERLLIDKGKRDDLLEGQAVVFGKAYVGQITELGYKNAWVETAYHKELDLAVRVAGKTVFGKLKVLNGQIIVDEVERNKALSVGDLLVTRGSPKDSPKENLDESVPAGILVGEIKTLIDDPTASFQKARVDPAVEPGELVDVFVVVEY